MSDPYAGATAGANASSRLDSVLFTLLRQAPDLEAASVVSFDGLPMASALPGDFDEDRVAAMSAALLSLGERAAQGLGRGELSQVYVEGNNGTVFLVSADDEAVLVAVGRQGAKVGLLLFEVKQAADAVAASLRVEHEAAVTPLVAVVPQEFAPVAQEEPVAEVVTEPAPQPTPEPTPEPEPTHLPAPEPLMAVLAPVMPAPVENVDHDQHEALPALTDEDEGAAFAQPMHTIQPSEEHDSEDTTYLPAPVANGTSAWGRNDREERSNPSVTGAPDNGSWN